MKTLIALSVLAMGATSALAQTTTTAPPAAAAKTPTMDQCKGGYKADFMKSQNWSKDAFDAACKTVMMKK